MIPVRALNIGAVPLLLFSPLHTGKGLEGPSDRQPLVSQCLFGLLIRVISETLILASNYKFEANISLRLNIGSKALIFAIQILVF